MKQSVCIAQNLVPNPSFELADSCPYDQDQMNFAVGWISYNSSPDYWNACCTSHIASVPYNICGFQYAATGSAYAGFISYADSTGVYNYSYREILGTKLNSPLSIGTKYYVSFKVSWTTSDTSQLGSNKFASNKLGALFTTTNPYTKHSNPLLPKNYSQIYTDSIITDSEGWVPIVGSFLADSAYQYIFIGNFFDDAHTRSLLANPTGKFRFAYYYVDDVYVSTDSLTGIGSYISATNEVQVYPNPCMNWFYVVTAFSAKDITSVKVMDQSGEEFQLSHLILNNNRIQCDVKNLAKGLYFLELVTSKRIYTIQLIIGS